jgi:hypothetical protein
MTSPFRDHSGAALARLDQLEAQLEELEQENVRLRTRVAPASKGDLATENARLREENGLLRVALESKRRELAKVSPPAPPDASVVAQRALVFMMGVIVVLGILFNALVH